MRVPSILPVFGIFAAAALLSIVAASFGARAIEHTSLKAVETQLRLEGFEWASVQTDGLQVVLTGTAPDEATQLAAQRAAGHVVDAARVMNVMAITQKEDIPAPRFSIEILRNDQGISLIGLVPSHWDRERFIDDLKKAGGTGSVADLLQEADYEIPPEWDTVITFGVDAIKRLPRSKISLASNGITVTALAESREQKAKFERDLKSRLPDAVPTTIDIAAPRPVITPFTARFLIDENGPRFDACTAETPQGHARLLAAATAVGIDNPACVVGLGAPSPSWASAVESGMRAVKELGGGSITFSDADVSLIADTGTSESLFDRVAGELEAALPDTFSLHATLPPQEDTEEDESKPEFVVLRSPEGQVQLRGRIADDRSQTATEALAKAAFGTHAVYAAMRVDDTLPNGWSLRAMTAIDALSRLDQGSVRMTEDFVAVRGETGDPEAKADITRLLSDRLGDGEDFDISVTYVRKLDPVLDLPTPDECVARANDIIASGKIVFAPGSTDVDSSADDTLDKIAKALEECENMEMEIGGHTDSQGREVMNQQLSQARANSVLDALLARRVVGVKFTANGYGEAVPIADNETEDGREANRRIEFKLIVEEPLAAQTETESDTAGEVGTDAAETAEQTTDTAPADTPADAEPDAETQSQSDAAPAVETETENGDTNE